MNNECQMKRSVSSCSCPFSVNLDKTGNDNTRDALTLLGKRYAGVEMANRKLHVTYCLRGKASEDQSAVFGALRTTRGLGKAYLSPESLGRFAVQKGI
jgi:hypothetical protein